MGSQIHNGRYVLLLTKMLINPHFEKKKYVEHPNIVTLVSHVSLYVWVDQNVGDVNTECVRLHVWLPILRLVANYMMGNGDLPILRLGGFHIWLLH